MFAFLPSMIDGLKEQVFIENTAKTQPINNCPKLERAANVLNEQESTKSQGTHASRISKALRDTFCIQVIEQYSANSKSADYSSAAGILFDQKRVFDKNCKNLQF